MNTSNKVRVGIVALSFAALLGLTGAASASPWTAHHPWRAQVNSRLANQNARIHTARLNGKITLAQARQLHRDDRQVRFEERSMASLHGTHLTKFQHRLLNKQENAISHKI
jgi:hypothetical protein